jgi:HTH-type transcriptional regulator, sugar sensing transcriptional regulator
MYENILKQVGLSEKQSRIYLACLGLGQAKAPEIARKAEIKRSTAYGILDELVKMGAVNSLIKGSNMFFRANDPNFLLELVERNQILLNKAMPGLEEMFISQNILPKIQFFEGVTGVKNIYRDALRCRAKKIYQVVNIRNHRQLLGDEFVDNYIKKRVAAGIIAYDLHPVSGDIYKPEKGMENPKFLRYVRYLPPDIFHASIIFIYDNKVAMVSSKQESFGFIIESKEFSKTLKAYFDLMWKLGSTQPSKD